MSRAGEHQVIVRMPVDLYEAAKAKSDAHERSMSQTVRWLLRLYVDGVVD